MSDTTDTWTIDQVAEYLGLQPGAARGTLSRWGVQRAGLTDDPRPKSLYHAADVRAAAANRPGRGARSDLTEPDPARTLPADWPERLLAVELAAIVPLPARLWQALAHLVRSTFIDAMWIEQPGELLASEVEECDGIGETDRAEIAAAARFWSRAQALAVIDACQRHDLDALPTQPQDPS